MIEVSEEKDSQKSEKKDSSFNLNQSFTSSNNSENEELFFSSKNLMLNADIIAKSAPPRSDKNKAKFFDSEEDEFKFEEAKKNLFYSENSHKLDKNRVSEAKSTEPTSIRVKNYYTPRKRFSIIKLIEKDKFKKRGSIYANKKEEKEILIVKKERTDIYGNIISKKNKKNIKVSFIDKVTTQPLVNIVQIESFKNYYYIDETKEKVEKTADCQCCIAF
jgi:hypothetical protein